MPNETFDDLNHAISEIIGLRNRNLLIMYYPDSGGIHLDDRKLLYSEFRDKQLEIDNEICEYRGNAYKLPFVQLYVI